MEPKKELSIFSKPWRFQLEASTRQRVSWKHSWILPKVALTISEQKFPNPRNIQHFAEGWIVRRYYFAWNKPILNHHDSAQGVFILAMVALATPQRTVQPWQLCCLHAIDWAVSVFHPNSKYIKNIVKTVIWLHGMIFIHDFYDISFSFTSSFGRIPAEVPAWLSKGAPAASGLLKAQLILIGSYHVCPPLDRGGSSTLHRLLTSSLLTWVWLYLNIFFFGFHDNPQKQKQNLDCKRIRKKKKTENSLNDLEEIVDFRW